LTGGCGTESENLTKISRLAVKKQI